MIQDRDDRTEKILDIGYKERHIRERQRNQMSDVLVGVGYRERKKKLQARKRQNRQLWRQGNRILLAMLIIVSLIGIYYLGPGTTGFFFTSPLNSSGSWQTGTGDGGVYLVTITASDGSSSTEQQVVIKVLPYCGDSECNAIIGETCATCPTDCGICAGSGGGGISSTPTMSQAEFDSIVQTIETRREPGRVEQLLEVVNRRGGDFNAQPQRFELVEGTAGVFDIELENIKSTPAKVRIEVSNLGESLFVDQDEIILEPGKHKLNL
ncbi:hypothetical protein ACFL0V_06995, partial [Nanoarchaeota archaeon]